MGVSTYKHWQDGSQMRRETEVTPRSGYGDRELAYSTYRFREKSSEKWGEDMMNQRQAEELWNRPGGQLVKLPAELPH
jgi:hypothetical protein